MRLVPIVVAALVLLQAPAAHAQEDKEAPANAIVATTPQGTTLAAADSTPEGGEDRIVLTQRGTHVSVEEPRFDDTEADLVPLWSDESVTVFNRLYIGEGSERLVLGGVVSADVMAIEQRFENGTVLRTATVPGDGYTGRYAGRVRFFLIEKLQPSGAPEDFGALRMLDASGAVLAVDDDESTVRRVRLLRERADGAEIRIYGRLESRQLALPLAPEHRRDSLCLDVETGTGDLIDRHESACQTIEEFASPPALRLGGLRGCARVPTTLSGFIPAESRALVVVLGSGRELRVAARTTPYGRPERVVVAVLPPGEAIRRVRAIDGAGRTLARGDVGVAPPDRRCDQPTSRDQGWSFTSQRPRAQFGVPPGTQVVAAEPTGPRLLVRDVGEQLCAGIDALALDGRDCEDPPESSRHGLLRATPDAAGGYLLWGTFPARVATLDLKLEGGGRLAIPLTDGPAYAGRYRGAVHFALFTLAANVVAEDIALLDAAGLRVGGAGVFCDECDDGVDDEPRPTTVLAAGTGSARVRVGAAATGAGRLNRDLCIAFAAAGERMDACTEFKQGEGTALGSVSCAPRQTIVYGMTHRSVRRVEIRLASGRRVNARLAALPSRLRARGSAFLAVLPANAAVTGVKFAGVKVEDASNTIPMPLRPAARQCGYTHEDSL